MKSKIWTKATLQKAQRCLAKSETIQEAVDLLLDLDIEVTKSTLDKGLFQHTGKRPGAFLKSARTQQEAPTSRVFHDAPKTQKPQANPVEDKFQGLVKALRTKPTFAELCDTLDMAPKKVRELLAKAKDTGMSIKFGAENIGLGVTSEADDYRHIKDISDVPPVVGDIQKVGVISDLHAGSKYFLRSHLQDFVNRAYEEGVREILVPGDLLDGCYKHGVFELSHSGIEDQTRDLFETLPRLDGLTYHCITGNHENTFVGLVGLDPGAYMVRYFKEYGRNDLFQYGERSAFVRVRGTVIHMWHPSGSAAYALSYKLQKQIEKYSSGEKPGILLVGHFHQHCTIFSRGVHGIACPTLQGGGSQFGKSLGGSPAIGGLILSWRLTEHNTIRDFGLQYTAYFEKEKPRELFSDR